MNRSAELVSAPPVKSTVPSASRVAWWATRRSLVTVSTRILLAGVGVSAPRVPPAARLAA